LLIHENCTRHPPVRRMQCPVLCYSVCKVSGFNRFSIATPLFFSFFQHLHRLSADIY
jgi:hypothetical protein